MITWADLDRRIAQAMARVRTVVELVSDIVFNDDGTASAKGLGEGEIESSIGWHFGFYSRPKDGARGIVAKLDAQGNTSVLIAFRDRQYELALEKGECGMQNAFEASVLLNKDGEVVFNGGTKKVARRTDPIRVGTLAAALVSGAVQLTFTPLDADGLPGAPAVGASVTLVGVVQDGAPKVLA